MLFDRDGEWHMVARVTGPRHNLLGLRLSAVPVASPLVERLSGIPSEQGVTAEEVLAQVTETVDAVNVETGSDHKLAAIRYVATDTPSRDAYRLMTR